MERKEVIMGKILVAYASKYGSTAEIAAEIVKVLQLGEHTVDVRPVDEITTARGYDAVVLGSAVYAGSWMSAAAGFMENNIAALTKIPVWLFSSGPTGEGDPAELLDGWTFPENLELLASQIGPRDKAVFHGNIDFKKLKWAERLLIKSLRASTGDARDWDMIRAWAEGIRATLDTL